MYPCCVLDEFSWHCSLHNNILYMTSSNQFLNYESWIFIIFFRHFVVCLHLVGAVLSTTASDSLRLMKVYWNFLAFVLKISLTGSKQTEKIMKKIQDSYFWNRSLDPVSKNIFRMIFYLELLCINILH